MINKLVTRAAMAFAMTLAVGACASTGGGNVVSADSARQVSEVEYGVVIDARQVVIQGNNDGVGAAAGGVIGAAAGSQVGGGTDDRIIAGVVGGVAGAIIGNEVEKGVDKQKGIQYTVRLENGRTISITQGANPVIPVNARVQILYDANGEARIQRI